MKSLFIDITMMIFEEKQKERKAEERKNFI